MHADRGAREALLHLIHDHITAGETVTLSGGITIEPPYPEDRATWTLKDTATLLVVLRVDMDAAATRRTELRIEDIRESWFRRTNPGIR
jgi:hypothetical protein